MSMTDSQIEQAIENELHARATDAPMCLHRSGWRCSCSLAMQEHRRLHDLSLDAIRYLLKNDTLGGYVSPEDKAKAVTPKDSWWSRLLCWLGCHYWDYPGGDCIKCGCTDSLWEIEERKY